MEFLNKVLEFFKSDIGSIIVTCVVFGFVCFVLYKILIGVLNRVSAKVNPNSLHWNILKQIIKVVVIVLFVISVVENVPALSKVGTTLLACSSVLAAAVGLASQNALGNAIDGLLISLFKPFAVGDRIRLNDKGITGTIADINLRYTTVKTFENNLLMIPNSVMNAEIIENYNIGDQRMVSFVDVEVSYDADIDLAKQTLIELALAHPLFLDKRTEEEKENEIPAVSVSVRALNASGVALRMPVWSENIGDSFKLCSELREQLLKAFKEKGIKIPYQTIEIIHNN